MTTADLTTLTRVKTWLNVTSTESDTLLSALITSVSAFVKAYISKDVIYTQYSLEKRNGNGKNRMMMRQLPLISVQALQIGDTEVAEAVDNVQAGYLADAATGLLWLRGYAFVTGILNIQTSYTAGWQHLNESGHLIPSTPYQINGKTALNDLWCANIGVSFVATGVALTKVTSAPITGQYAVDSAGLYTFAAADTTKEVAISYGYVPAPIEEAVFEIVGEAYRRKSVIGLNSKSIGGETTSYITKVMNATAKMMLDQYRTIVPLD